MTAEDKKKTGGEQAQNVSKQPLDKTTVDLLRWRIERLQQEVDSISPVVDTLSGIFTDLNATQAQILDRLIAVEQRPKEFSPTEGPINDKPKSPRKRTPRKSNR